LVLDAQDKSAKVLVEPKSPQRKKSVLKKWLFKLNQSFFGLRFVSPPKRKLTINTKKPPIKTSTEM
jgi:hypothetical protein